MPATAREFPTLALERQADGTAELTFVVQDHRHNVLTRQVFVDLAAALDELVQGPRPRGLILRSGREGSFFAGADLDRLDVLATLPAAEITQLCDAGKELFARLSAHWPTVAVIDGTCLGGGLELALACDLRVATTAPHTSLGLPEVKLGLLPGWGGTVRLPRLIGPGPAVELVAGGESIDGQAALCLGLVDACVPADVALETARRVAEIHAVSGGCVARRRRLRLQHPLRDQLEHLLDLPPVLVAIEPQPVVVRHVVGAHCQIGHRGGHEEAQCKCRFR